MKRPFKLSTVRTVAGPSGVVLSMLSAVALVVVATMMTLAPGQSVAKPAYTKSTGRPCTACHTTPPKLNACGKKYAKDKKTKC